MVLVRTPKPAPDAPAERGAILASAPVLTTTEAARRDGVTPKCIRQRIKAGRLDGIKVGDRWLVTEPKP